MTTTTKAAKTTYVATAPDGTEFTRTTKTRTYTHAVLVWVRETESPRGPHWGLLSFNSRHELALDEARRWGGGTRIGGDVWDEPIVVEAVARS